MSVETNHTLISRLPGGPPEGALGAFAERARRVPLDEGARLFQPGDEASAFLLLVAGSVRVEMTAAGGRAAVLYRIAPGESCILTTSCLLSDRDYAAAAIAETDGEALVLAKGVFFEVLNADAGFRRLVFGAYSDRIADLARTIEELLLKRVDARLALHLADRAPELSTTHEGLAHELGSAREAVSRILKEFERRGWVGLGRGRLTVLDPPALRRFAEAIGARAR